MCVECMFIVRERRPHAAICIGPPLAIALAIIWFSLDLPDDGAPDPRGSRCFDSLRWLRPNTDTTWVPDELRPWGFALCVLIWTFSFWITCFKIIAFTTAPSEMALLAYLRAALAHTCFGITKAGMDLYSKAFKRSESIFWIDFVMTFSMLAMYIYAICVWAWRGYRAFAARRLRDEEANAEEGKHLAKSPSSENQWMKVYSLWENPKQGETAIQTEKSTINASY